MPLPPPPPPQTPQPHPTPCAEACRDEDFLLPERVLQELQEEAGVMQKMRHPNVVGGVEWATRLCGVGGWVGALRGPHRRCLLG